MSRLLPAQAAVSCRLMGALEEGKKNEEPEASSADSQLLRFGNLQFQILLSFEVFFMLLVLAFAGRIPKVRFISLKLSVVDGSEGNQDEQKWCKHSMIAI